MQDCLRCRGWGFRGGVNGIQRAVAMESIIGRMAHPISERGTWNWLADNSATDELLNVDFAGMPVMRLYRVSDILIRRREDIEKALYARISDLFSLQRIFPLNCNQVKTI
jgi:hypothetical protein